MTTKDRALRPARVRVPASTSNLGAGFDCIGLALDRYLSAAYDPDGDRLRLQQSGTLVSLGGPAEDDLLVRSFRDRLRAHGVTDPTGTLHVHSEIPIARGLGSSAAAIIAGLMLGDDATGGTVDDRVGLLRDAENREGHPDNLAPSLFGGLVAVARGEDGNAHTVPLPLSNAVGFAFAAPGVDIPTNRAREALPAEVPHATAARALGRFAALQRGLATGLPELIRIGFRDELHVPYRLPLIPGAERAAGAAEEAGSWAVTISGSGSGLIAVCPPERAGAAADAMADGFRTGTGSDGTVAFVARPDWYGARLQRTREREDA